MLKTSTSVMSVILVVLFLCPGLFAQESTPEKPLRLSDYRVVQYISCRGYSPNDIIWADNNQDILLACREGKTRKQLAEMGIETTESQIKLLEVYDLLSEKGGVLTTAFPILNPDQTGRLREYSQDLSARLVPIIKSDIIELVDNLKQIKREKNTYSILFGYVFDGMVWDEFEARQLVQPNAFSIDHPFWVGEVYAFYPRRAFSSGRNSWSADPYTFCVNWSEPANPLLSPFYREIKKMDDDLFLNMMDTGRIDDEATRAAFASFGILDQHGQLTLPVIEEGENNAIYTISREISRKTAENTLKLMAFDQLINEFHFRDTQQAIVVFYHELMWDMMDQLEADGIVKKPKAFIASANATSRDIADLMFIVKTP